MQIGSQVLGRSEADAGPDGPRPEPGPPGSGRTAASPADSGQTGAGSAHPGSIAPAAMAGLPAPLGSLAPLASLAALGPQPGGDGTLLAVVPIPGTGTSLAIVGYPVTVPVGPPDGTGPGVTSPGVTGPGDSLTGTVLLPAARPAAGYPGLLLDHEQRRVWADGAEIPLTFQEFELLAFLSAHPATVFSRADLVREVWQRDFAADSRTVDVHVSRLRHKLGRDYGRCLVTEYRVGYQFRPQ